MPSLSERLKALGVQIGAGNLAPAKERAEHPIHTVVDGRVQETDFGEAFVLERFIPADEIYGHSPLRFPATLEKLAAWADDARLALVEPERFLFLDSESTGIYGSGTLALSE